MKLRLMICAAAASTALFATEDANSATYAVMNVTNAYTDTVIAVPWVGLDGSTITISNLVNTTTLAEGDKLYMYDNGTWYEYTKSGAIWTVAETVSESGTHTAESQVVARGSGLILKRGSAGGTVLLCGRVDSNSIQTTIATGKTLFANPTAADVDLNTKFTAAAGAANGDTITLPLNNGGTDKYTFNGTEWGKMTLTEQTLANGRKRKTNTWSKCGSIPAGTGAWYETTGTGYTVEW
jgi:hypothetical protein